MFEKIINGSEQDALLEHVGDQKNLIIPIGKSWAKLYNIFFDELPNDLESANPKYANTPYVKKVLYHVQPFRVYLMIMNKLYDIFKNNDRNYDEQFVAVR